MVEATSAHTLTRRIIYQEIDLTEGEREHTYRLLSLVRGVCRAEQSRVGFTNWDCSGEAVVVHLCLLWFLCNFRDCNVGD